MAFVRVWWPPVVVGLVVAFLAIGLVEVAGTPAGGAPVAAGAPSRPVPRPTWVEPAAIERDGDVADEPRTVVVEPRVTTAPSPTPSPSSAAPREHPKPRPKPKSTPTPRPKSRPAPRVTPSMATQVAPSPTPPPTPSPSVAAPPKSAPVRPSQILDLRRWKLTLPVGRQGHPAEYRQPALGSLASGAYIRLTPDHGVAFRAPVGGATTGNSSYPRSELREMSPDGRHEAGWTNVTGRHVMTINQAITATPRVKPHVVAGQIHDADDDVVMIRLEGRRLFVESEGDDVGLLDPAYRLGTRFTVSIAASPAGIQVTYDRSRIVRLRRVGRGWYFKAGCYPQSNPERGDRPSAYGEVVIYTLTVRHS